MPEGSGDGPPMAILVVCACSARSASSPRCWPGGAATSPTGSARGAIVVCTITGLPAFFVDVPMGIKALVGAGVLITVLAVVLMFSGTAAGPAGVS